MSVADVFEYYRLLSEHKIVFCTSSQFTQCPFSTAKLHTKLFCKTLINFEVSGNRNNNSKADSSPNNNVFSILLNGILFAFRIESVHSFAKRCFRVCRQIIRTLRSETNRFIFKVRLLTRGRTVSKLHT